MKHTEYRAVVGSRGWQRAEWAGSFYPEDMPPEWQLAYYANELTGVLVPAREWRQASSRTLATWAAEVPDGFLFLLEADPTAPDASNRARSLGESFGGWVSRDGGDGLRTAVLKDAVAHAAPVVLLRAADLDDRRALGRRLTALAHRQPPPRALFVTDAVDGHSLRELRVLAELVGIA